MLIPNPLDLELSINFSKFQSYFLNLNYSIYTGYLNLKTLQLLHEFDCVIIVSDTFKGKIYIENDNLKSNLINITDLISYFYNDNICYIIITDSLLSIDSSVDQKIINIGSYKSSTINRFIFKTLRNKSINYNDDEIKFINVEPEFIKLPFKNGVSNYESIYGETGKVNYSRKILNAVVGRVEEQFTIASRILNIIESNKLLNIKGSGGIGKTTLVKKISYELYIRGYFKQGVSFVSCENMSNYNDFYEAVVQAFNLKDVVDFKRYLLETQGKIDLLIILDNFETVNNFKDKDDFNKVIDLLEFATDYAFLIITSRENIGVYFEDIYSLTPLTTDDAEKLFVREYGEISSNDELRILRTDILENLLNNNPLAIKIVTRSRTRFKYIQELKEQLQLHFFESTSEDYTSIYKNDADLNIERTKSIYQSINYSYLKLNTLQRLAFEILHLFPDGISLSNFKDWFSRKNSTNNISDKEFRALKDKSLVEDDDGILRLQPIIRRFAEFHFLKRSAEVKKKYYMDAYSFNSFISDIATHLEMSKSQSVALGFFNLYRNNLLNTLDYIQYVSISDKSIVKDKTYFINYIIAIQRFVIGQKDLDDFIAKINTVSGFFLEVEGANEFLETIKYNKVFFIENFDVSYEKLCKIMPASEMDVRDYSAEKPLERRYKDVISYKHSMEGWTMNFVNMVQRNGSVDLSVNVDLFYLGIPVFDK